MKSKAFDLGDEKRTIEWGMDGDEVVVRQVSSGDLTDFAYSAGSHVDTVRFTPSDTYGLEDVEQAVEGGGQDFFISDVVNNLKLWGVPYTTE